MKNLVYLFAIIILLSGCSSELTFSEVNLKNADNHLQWFLDTVRDENGVHLYYESEKVVYVYLNGINAEEDGTAVYFTGFEVRENGNTLDILYNSAKTTNYSDPSLKHERLYKIKRKKDYEMIRLFKNGEETHFGTVAS